MTPFDLSFNRGDSTRLVRWISLHDPSEAEVSEALATLGLPETFARRLVTRSGPGVRRPSLGHVDGVEVLSLRLLSYDDQTDEVSTGEARVVFTVDAVLSLVHPPRGDKDLLSREKVEQASPGDGQAAAAVVLRAAVERYEAVCSELQNDVEEVEQSVFSGVRVAEAERIYTLRREVAEVRRAVVPLMEALGESSHGSSGERRVGGEVNGVATRRSAADVPVATPELLERMHRVAESVDTLTALLTTVFDAHVSMISLQQNADMRRISAVAALVVVPSLVAGIYGMNFRHMPELDWRYGYPMVISFMLGSVVVMSAFFKRSGWF